MDAVTENDSQKECDVEASDETKRTLLQWWTYVAVAVILVALPWVTASTGVALACIFAGPFLMGLVDGWQFRFTWSFPVLTGLVFWISKGMFYQDEAWIYVVPVVVLAALGGKLGEVARGR